MSARGAEVALGVQRDSPPSNLGFAVSVPGRLGLSLCAIDKKDLVKWLA